MLFRSGPFVEAEKDLGLRFRGSANQRILDVPASMEAHAPVLWDGEGRIQPITAERGGSR